MSAATQHVQALARAAAARTLQQAATFAAAHSGPALFSRAFRQPGGKKVLVRFDWPGVLRVFDPASGELLAQSRPGQPFELGDPS